MRLDEVEALLDNHNLEYKLSLIGNRGEFYRNKGFLEAKDDTAFILLTIPNPNHAKNIELIFKTADDNPEFSDLEFGGHWYELFDCQEEQLPSELLKEIKDILSGRLYIIIARDNKTLAWLFDGAYLDSPDEDQNDMEAFRKMMNRIKHPKGWWKKLRGKTTQYEVFSWESYESIIN